MGRPRKNAVRRQDALLAPQEVAEIPMEEQPYPLPDGWKWVRFGDCNGYVGEIINPAHLGEKTFELYSVPSSSNNFPEIILGKEIGSSKQIVEKDDILLCKINPRINRVWMVAAHTNNILIASSEWIIFRNKNILSKYMMYCMKSQYFRRYMLSNVSGVGGSLMRAKPKYVRNYPIPLPPRDVQQRIVDRIESFFAKLDEAKEQAEAVLDGFETRKAAILHKAFTGKLTEKWRKENNLQLSGWKYEKIASLCHSLKYGTAKKSKNKGSIIVLRMGNLQGGEIDWNNLAYTDDKEDIEKYILYKDDVLFNRTNSSELVGKTSIYRGEYPAIYAGYLIKMDYNRNILVGQYLNYIMNSEKAKIYYNRVKSDGVNQSNINAKKLGSFIIPVPSLREQEEIVRVLDVLLAKEKQAKDAAETVLEEIELMKKSILARAFRGELSYK